MGFQSHYDFLKSIIKFDSNNLIHLVLFHTGLIEMCIVRGHLRHKNGGHLVKENIIREMYENTIPLLKSNLKLFNTTTFIDVSNKGNNIVSKSNLPNWIIDNKLEELV